MTIAHVYNRMKNEDNTHVTDLGFLGQDSPIKNPATPMSLCPCARVPVCVCVCVCADGG